MASQTDMVPERTSNKDPGYDEDDDVLADYFEKSASAVRRSFERQVHHCLTVISTSYLTIRIYDRFEQDVARPVFSYLLKSFHRRPIRSVRQSYLLAVGSCRLMTENGSTDVCRVLYHVEHSAGVVLHVSLLLLLVPPIEPTPALHTSGFSLFIFATSIFVGLAAAIFCASCAVGFFGESRHLSRFRRIGASLTRIPYAYRFLARLRAHLLFLRLPQPYRDCPRDVHVRAVCPSHAG